MVEAGKEFGVEWLAVLCGGVMVGVASGGVGFCMVSVCRGGGDPMKCGS